MRAAGRAHPACHHVAQMSATERETFTVEGMTCEHCVRAVSEEVGRVPGVSGVDVVLDSGTLVVDGDPIDREAVRAAVEEAGYSLAGPA